eukprot:gene4314-5038_t
MSSTTPTKKVTISEQPKVAYTETRAKKKAREVLDLISDKKQRQESVLNLLGKDYTGPTESQLEMIFRLFDRDRDGKIGPLELASVLRSMGKRPLTKRLDKIMSECDEDSKGFIEMDEFVRYMQRKAIEKARQLGLLQDDDDVVSDVEGGDTDEETETTTDTSKKRKAPVAAKPSAKKKVKEVPVSTTPSAVTAAAAAVVVEKQILMKQPSFFVPVTERAPSLVNFYTENAGIHTANNVPLDTFNNPAGNNFDLGIEGAFNNFNILFGLFFPYTLNPEFVKELDRKGFRLTFVKTHDEFIKALPTSDVAAILSSRITSAPYLSKQAEFAQAVRNYHQSGKGLYIFSDDEPLIVEANWIIGDLFPGCKVVGNEPGGQVLGLGDGKTVKTFGSHLITSGITQLYEGITISHMPRDCIPKQLSILATSSQGNPIVLHSIDSELAENHGRVVVDTGYTKCMGSFYTAGTGRYIKNAFVWLLGLDHRHRIGASIQGVVAEDITKPSQWQYKHGATWMDFDDDLVIAIEEEYKKFQVTPSNEISFISTGKAKMEIDFNKMSQIGNLHHNSHCTLEHFADK